MQADFAFLPAVPLSPHVHVLGAFTPKSAKQLPPELLKLCNESRKHGVIFVSMGTTAIPGEMRLMHGVILSCSYVISDCYCRASGAVVI